MLFQLMCTVEDLKEMGIPLGPRKKIAKFVKERVNKLVRLQISPPSSSSCLLLETTVKGLLFYHQVRWMS